MYDQEVDLNVWKQLPQQFVTPNSSSMCTLSIPDNFSDMLACKYKVSISGNTHIQGKSWESIQTNNRESWLPSLFSVSNIQQRALMLSALLAPPSGVHLNLHVFDWIQVYWSKPLVLNNALILKNTECSNIQNYIYGNFERFIISWMYKFSQLWPLGPKWPIISLII